MLLESETKKGITRYGYTLISDAHDTDSNGFLRPSSILRYLQTAANLQMHTYGPSNEELRAGGQAFVLTRIALKFLKPITAYEELYAESWALESAGYSFERCYRLSCSQEVIAEAQSVWALLDIETKKPLPVEKFRAGFGTDAGFETPMPLRIRMPIGEDFSMIGTHRVSYAETDMNHHMNNTCYPDMLIDFLPQTQQRIHSLIINFRQEAPSASLLTVYHALNNGVDYFRTVREDGRINIEAAINTIQ